MRVCVGTCQCPLIWVINKMTPSQNKQGRSLIYPSAVQGLFSKHERPQLQTPELQNREERKKTVVNITDKN